MNDFATSGPSVGRNDMLPRPVTGATITDKINGLRAALEDLESFVEMRLGPVLGPDNQLAQLDMKPVDRGGQSDLADQLDGAQGQIRRVRALIERSQIV